MDKPKKEIKEKIKEIAHKKNIIHLHDVAKHYQMGDNVVKAVDGISLDIEKGDFVAVMGPSGSGKSTAMNLIGSLDMPTHGHIFLDKEDISELDESELAQVRGKNIGFIFQQFNLIPTLTVKENIMLPMTLQGLSEYEREEKADKILQRLDMYDRKDHYPNQISGGQQQRVAIARALANDPEVILADEPTGNLDTKTGLIVMDFLTELNKEGRTIVLVTHSPELAKKYAHTVYWLKDGKIERITKERRKG
jgi:putative ABC transport system ATP-binding protein